RGPGPRRGGAGCGRRGPATRRLRPGRRPCQPPDDALPISDPPEPPRPRSLWRRIVGLPASSWRFAGELTMGYAEVASKQPSKRRLTIIRIALFVVVLAMAPWVLIGRAIRTPKPAAADLLYQRLVQLWQTDPWAAVAKVRAVYEVTKPSSAFRLRGV